ncbi:MerR family transcriptional regulator [Permianibacter aggregans]|uniref:MerR family transcriptional regulator n=1 Tax=Permianibacter aggregans TaxID=1510150 RepID=A0A4R6UI07_9GAMM|nr:MerR family DNA-binding transcriptional regulator [Permianibacter aggregans]QGX41608.1 MerR family DNA-binding transcriptional regulator [Permianibacter aggregans]TDQ45676.1 MerR family transcriptional regulator [Permianibacter aggregans]
MKQTFSISDLAREFDVTPRSLRHYEDEGLLSPERQGQQRIYSVRDRVRLALIIRGKNIGFSLAEIREIIDLYDLPHGEELQAQVLRAKIARRRASLLEQRSNIDHMLQELEAIDSRIQSVKVKT